MTEISFSSTVTCALKTTRAFKGLNFSGNRLSTFVLEQSNTNCQNCSNMFSVLCILSAFWHSLDFAFLRLKFFFVKVELRERANASRRRLPCSGFQSGTRSERWNAFDFSSMQAAIMNYTTKSWEGGGEYCSNISQLCLKRIKVIRAESEKFVSSESPAAEPKPTYCVFATRQHNASREETTLFCC